MGISYRLDGTEIKLNEWTPLEKAIKQLKNRMMNAGTFATLKLRKNYPTGAARRRQKQLQTKRRWEANKAKQKQKQKEER